MSDRDRSRTPSRQRSESPEVPHANVVLPAMFARNEMDDSPANVVAEEEEVEVLQDQPAADIAIESLLGGTPEQYDVSFAAIIKQSPVRGMIVARYIVANMLPFPRDIIDENLPALSRITEDLAKKAGSPYEWASIMMLPLFGLSCAIGRLWINELFLIPPCCWPNSVLDSGANKSGILLAISEVASLFERQILKKQEKNKPL